MWEKMTLVDKLIGNHFEFINRINMVDKSKTVEEHLNTPQTEWS